MTARLERLSRRLSGAASRLVVEYPDTAELVLRVDPVLYVELRPLLSSGVLRLDVPVPFVLSEASLPAPSVLLWQSDVLVEVVRGQWRPAAALVHDVPLEDPAYEVYARLVQDGVAHSRALELSQVL